MNLSVGPCPGTSHRRSARARWGAGLGASAGVLLVLAQAPSASADTAPPDSPALSQLRLTAPPALVDTGTPVTFAGVLSHPDGTPVAGETVDLLARTLGTGSVARLGQATTGPDGAVTVRLVPRVNAEYQLHFAGSPATAASDSGLASLRVRPAVASSLSAASAVLGGGSVLSGVLAPDYQGARLVVQRLYPDGWHPLATIGTAAGGGYAFPLQATDVGREVLRVALVGTAAYEAAVSAPATLLVDPRDLRPGDRGPDVLALEQRLAALGFHLGALDGFFGPDTMHALTAFQKLAGLPRTGAYDAVTRARLSVARPATVRHPSAGLAVEVDITHQVLILSRGGVLVGVLDTSTGTDRLYVSDGVTYRANTPRGAFRVTWKVDGIRISRLGQLYRPAFFVQGWAIHGAASVPVYPASHGCVRVTDSAMDWLYPMLTVGTPVSVYDA